MTKKSDEMPKWLIDEIQGAEFEDPLQMRRRGYILEIYESDRKVDIQLYEPVDDGRHIVTMDVPSLLKASDLQRGIVYEFEFDSMKAPLSEKVAEFLRRERDIEMSAVFQFRLRNLEAIEAGPGEP